jgi:putative protein-disulfide isomerase
MSAKLHYIYDPLCGWCYGAEPLVRAAGGVEGLEIRLHGGNLWPAPTQLPEGTRRYIQQADARIAKLSGQPFGAAYLEGLLLDPTMVLESRPPTAAILAAESIDPGNALPMLHGIQRAHYVDGRRVVTPEVLASIAGERDIDRAAFEEALDRAPVEAHVNETHALMQRVGAQGFPTFVLEVDGALHGVPQAQFASDAQGFAGWLESAVRASRAAAV